MSDPTDDDTSAAASPGRVARVLRWVGPAIAVVLIAGAVWVLWDMATKMSFADIHDAALALPAHRFVLAFVFTYYAAYQTYLQSEQKVIAGHFSIKYLSIHSLCAR